MLVMVTTFVENVRMNTRMVINLYFINESNLLVNQLCVELA